VKYWKIDQASRLLELAENLNYPQVVFINERWRLNYLSSNLVNTIPAQIIAYPCATDSFGKLAGVYRYDISPVEIP
jgi:hypothetical protein